MARTKDPNTEVRNLQKRIDRLEHLLNSNRKLTSRANDRVVTVLNNQKHYLRHRAPGVLKRQKDLITKAVRLMRRLECIPKLNIQTSHKKHNSADKHIIFMCTGNEARKLRQMINIDFRMFNSCKVKKLHHTLNYSGAKK